MKVKSEICHGLAKAVVFIDAMLVVPSPADGGPPVIETQDGQHPYDQDQSACDDDNHNQIANINKTLGQELDGSLPTTIPTTERLRGDSIAAMEELIVTTIEHDTVEGPMALVVLN